LRIARFNLDHKAILDLLVSFLLLSYLFTLLSEQNILFLSHQRVPQEVSVDEIVRFKRALKDEAIVMPKDTSSFHSILFPLAFIDVSISPFHFSLLMIGPFLKATSVFELLRYSESPLSLLLVSVPCALG
jgi:hypothetical protein